MRLALSAGHGLNRRGRPDPGAVNEELELTEHAVALELTDALSSRLAGSGLDIVAVDAPQTLSRKIAAVNAAHTQESIDLAVEIHLNSFRDPEAHGTEVLYYSRSHREKAATVSRHLSEALNTFDRGAKRRTDLGWLKRTKCPALLVEVLFLSNLEAARIHTNNFHETAAAAIAGGIGEAMGLKDVLKTIGTTAGKIGDVAGIPGLNMIDDAIAAVEKSKATKAETEAITTVLEGAKAVTVAPRDKTPLQSKKFIAGIGGLITIGAGILASAMGVDPVLVSDAIEKVVALVMAYLAAQGTADAVRAVRG